MGGKRAIEAAIERDRMERELASPVTIRTLTIDFDERTVDINGSRIKVQSRAFSIPILSTERVIISKGTVDL